MHVMKVSSRRIEGEEHPLTIIIILEPCGNRQSLALINEFEQRVSPLVRLRVTETAVLERPVREHAKILELCKARAVQPAMNALRIHIETTRREVAASVRRDTIKALNLQADSKTWRGNFKS